MKLLNIAFEVILLQLFCALRSHGSSHDNIWQDDTSIIETYMIETGAPWNTQFSLNNVDNTKHRYICAGNKSAAIKADVLESIEKTLKFYQSHMDTLPPSADDSIGIAILKAVDDKHGGRFQATYPLSTWVVQLCHRTSGENKKSCEQITEMWVQHKTDLYKSADVLNKINVTTELVGTEKEYLWPPLNALCQSALLFRCEVLHICNITLYDPVPRSMYFFSHQLLKRIITEQSKCTSVKKLLSQAVNDQLCAKMFHEARLLSQLDFPFILRDIFAEYVMFCGYMGYPNFLREDWIQAIISWQSRSEYGFFTDSNYDGEFTLDVTKITRKQTSDELLQGTRSEKEVCITHFTSVAFSALTMSWDYMEENCN